MLNQQGTSEHPAGSNTDNNGFIDSSNRRLDLYRVPWCATSESKVEAEGNVISPLVNSARALDFAVDEYSYTIKQVDDGLYHPKPGDRVVWDYGGGRGHIDQIISFDSSKKKWILIGGNRRDAVSIYKATTNKLILGRAKWVVDVTGTYPTEIVYTGIASYYGAKFHGRRTASGEVYNMNALTAAHKAMKFGTMVEVTNLRAGKHYGKTVTVRINDRGPYIAGREIDLSKAAADSIGLKLGTVRMRIINESRPSSN